VEVLVHHHLALALHLHLAHHQVAEVQVQLHILGPLEVGQLVEILLVQNGEVGEVVVKVVDDEHILEVVIDEVGHKLELLVVKIQLEL
jgi:hypothetical protein